MDKNTLNKGKFRYKELVMHLKEQFINGFNNDYILVEIIH